MDALRDEVEAMRDGTDARELCADYVLWELDNLRADLDGVREDPEKWAADHRRRTKHIYAALSRSFISCIGQESDPRDLSA